MSNRASAQAIQGRPPSTLVSPALAALAEPAANLVDAAMMDYFFIEVVNALKASSAVATARSKKLEKDMIESGLIPPPPPQPPALPLKKETPNASTTSLSSRSPAAAKSPADEEEEAVRTRLEAIGMHVGSNITERLCRDRPLFNETLDAIKFICKDIWSACWDKQVDNLRTNHRGVYVLQDNAHKPISRLSSWLGRPDAVKRSKLYVALPAGIIRGALSRLGIQGTVSPEITNLPQCTFQVKLPRA